MSAHPAIDRAQTIAGSTGWLEICKRLCADHDELERLRAEARKVPGTPIEVPPHLLTQQAAPPRRDERKQRCTACGGLVVGTCALMADGKHRLRDEASAPITKATHAAEWIPVERDLPPSLRMVLMYMPQSYRGPVSYGYVDPVTRNFMVGMGTGWGECRDIDAVTHWMPLPKPPPCESPAPQSTDATMGRDNVSPDRPMLAVEAMHPTCYQNGCGRYDQQTPLPAERDAARYRGWRAIVVRDNKAHEIGSAEFWNAFDLTDAAEIDARIDAAIASQAGAATPSQ